MSFEYVRPTEIEARSFEIIRSELKTKYKYQNLTGDKNFEQILLRVIHTSADFDYAENLNARDDAISSAIKALRQGASIVTDTNMAKTGIDKTRLSKAGGEVFCFMADEDIAQTAQTNGTTRAAASMEKAARLLKDRLLIFAIGNAPTALARVVELAAENKITPSLVIGVPVGFVNVVESKEMLLASGLPYITALKRKGGSNVAAAICNALLRLSLQ